MKRSVSLVALVAIAGQVGAVDPSVILDQAQEAVGAGRNAKAISLYTEYLRIEPDDSHARMEFAQVLSWEGEYDEAIREYHRLLAGAPDSQELRFGLAQALAWSGKTRAALAELATLVEASPRNRSYRLLQAQALSWGGELAAAIDRYRAILEDDPDDAVAWSGLGDTYKWAEKPEEAEQAYRRALALDPRVEAAKSLPLLLADKRFVSILPGAARFRDADGVSVWWSAVGASGRLDWHWSSRVLYDASLIAQERENITRHRLVLGAGRTLGDILKVEAQYILSSYSGGEETHGARLDFQAPLPGGGSAHVQVSRADIFDDVLTFRSVAGKVLYGYIGRGDFWHDLPWGFSLGGGGALGRYSDDNEMASGSFSLGYTVSRKPAVTLSYGFSLLTYREKSSRYWSPSNYRSQGLRLSSSYTVFKYLKLEAEGYLGRGNEAGQRTLEFGGSGKLGFELPRKLSAAFQYQYGESARMSTGGGNYWSQRWNINLSYRF